MHVDTARGLSLLASAVYVPEDHGLVHCAGWSTVRAARRQGAWAGLEGRTQAPRRPAPRPRLAVTETQVRRGRH